MKGGIMQVRRVGVVGRGTMGQGIDGCRSGGFPGNPEGAE